MIGVTIRLDAIEDDTLSRLESFLSRYEKYLVYDEISDVMKKRHYQGILYVEDQKAYGALKTRFSTTFKSWTKGQKSMSLVKKDSYEIYISKDKNPVLIKNYQDDEIKKLQELSYKKPVKVKKETFYEQVKHQFDEYLIAERKRPGQKVDWFPSRGQIAIWLCDTFDTFNKLWDVPILTKYVNVLEWQGNRGNLSRLISREIENRY